MLATQIMARYVGVGAIGLAAGLASANALASPANRPSSVETSLYVPPRSLPVDHPFLSHALAGSLIRPVASRPEQGTSAVQTCDGWHCQNMKDKRILFFAFFATVFILLGGSLLYVLRHYDGPGR